MPVIAGGDVARAARSAGFLNDDLITATAIAFAESGFNTTVIANEPDGSKSYGLWQINSSHGFAELSSGAWQDPAVNAALAYRVFKSQGWNAWSTHKPTDTAGYARYIAARPAAAAYVAIAMGDPKSAVKSIIGTPGDVASSATGAAGQAFDLIAEIAKEPLTVLKWFEQPETWYRIARLVAGGILLTTGVYLFMTSALAKPIVSGVKSLTGAKAAGNAAKAAKNAKPATAA